jgi:pantoate--beta-alanine ligase
MSSRNARLNVNERIKAGLIFQSLQDSKNELLNGVDIDAVKKQIIALYNEQDGMDLEYFELVETENFSKVTTLKYEELALCIAVNVGDVRLIDNFLIIS